MEKRINTECICRGYTKKNIRCRYKCKKGFEYCGIHIKKFEKGSEKKIEKEKIVVKIQKRIRGYVVRNIISNRGIGVYCRHLCNNDTDCFTYDELDSIKRENFITYKDDKNYWGFDIETLEELIRNEMPNPYNLNKIPDKIKEIVKLKEKEKCIKSIDLWCTEIFQRMDMLNNYTKCEWFLDLNIKELMILYKELEDIWNYRLNLSDSEKLKYTSDGKLFEIPLKIIYNKKSKLELQRILLGNFNKLIEEGKSKSDKITASQWILAGLTIVNRDARDTLPWLYSSLIE